MSSVKRLRLDTRRGRTALSRLESRGGTVVDRKTLKQARRIVRDVRQGGDAALLRAVARYDRVEVDDVAELRLDAGAEPSASSELPAGFEAALDRAIDNVSRFHRAQRHEGFRIESEGLLLEERRIPLRRVGLYVPGGRFPYPSTVLMTVVPARIAGVEEIAVVTPARAWQQSPALRHTLRRLEVDEVWGIGGAHAVGALAYGTESIRPVELIAGPGNAWVTAAKQVVSGDVGIDMDAGPSEVAIVASSDARPERLAINLLAQAEHDPNAMSVLITPDARLAKRTAKEVDRRLETLPTRDTARAALEARGAIFVVEDMEEALAVAERLAPEHLELVGAEAEQMADRFCNAGAIFVGDSTPTAFGDYVAGPSHVLPTGRTARYASGLGVDDFLRRSHTVRATGESARALARDAALLADLEGLAAHAASARMVLEPDGAEETE